MVASVPLFPKRHRGSPYRSDEVRRHHHRVVDRLGEMGAKGDPLGHRFDDGRMGVAGQHGSITAVVVDVLVSVDVEEPRTGPPFSPDRMGKGDLPAGGDASGQGAAGPLRVRARTGAFGQEPLVLGGDYAIEGRHLEVVAQGHHGFPFYGTLLIGGRARCPSAFHWAGGPLPFRLY